MRSRQDERITRRGLTLSGLVASFAFNARSARARSSRPRFHPILGALPFDFHVLFAVMLCLRRQTAKRLYTFGIHGA